MFLDCSFYRFWVDSISESQSFCYLMTISGGKLVWSFSRNSCPNIANVGNFKFRHKTSASVSLSNLMKLPPKLNAILRNFRRSPKDAFTKRGSLHHTLLLQRPNMTTEYDPVLSYSQHSVLSHLNPSWAEHFAAEMFGFDELTETFSKHNVV